MAIIKCKECGAEVSNKAGTCIKCGAPLRFKPKTGHAIIIIVVIIAVVSLFDKGGGSKTDSHADEQTSKKSCAKDDLDCLGNEGIVGASVYCKDPIERLAQHDVKWTDGTFEMKFSRFRWKDKDSGIITYIGDKVEFQNGFGAFTPMTYECDMAADNKTVLDVRVTEGRLPN